MSFIGSVIEKTASTAFHAAHGVGKMAWSGGALGRTLVGAGVGAGTAWWNADYNSSQATANEVLQGALWGAVGGLALHGAASGVKYGARQINANASRNIALEAMSKKWKTSPEMLQKIFPEKLLAKRASEVTKLQKTG